MTAYNLEIDGVFHGLWRTAERAQEIAEQEAGNALEWHQEGGLTAFYEIDKGYSRTSVIVRITIANGIEDDGYHLTMKSARGWNCPTLQAVTESIGMSDGHRSGFLTEWAFVPKIQKWLALYWDKDEGAEIATVEKVRVIE